MKRKLLSVMLSLAMVLCMIPATAIESFAGGHDGNTLTLDDSMMSYTMHIDETYNFQDETEEKQWYYHPSTLVLNPSEAGYYQLEFTYFYTELDDRKVIPSFEGTLTQDYFNDITKLSDNNVLENKVLKKRTVPFYIDTQANGPLKMNMSYWEEGHVSAFFKFKVDLVPVTESDLNIKDISLDLASCFVNNYAYTPEEMLSDDGTYYQLPNKNEYIMDDLRDNILFRFSYNYYYGSSMVFDHTSRNPNVEITKYLGGNYFNISDDGTLATRELDYGYHIEAQILDGNGNPMDMREANSNLRLGYYNFYSICLKMYDRNGNAVFDKTYRFRTSGVQKFEITSIDNIQAAAWSNETTKTGDNQFEYDCTAYEENPTVDQLFNLFRIDYSIHGDWGEDKDDQFSYLKTLIEDEDYSVSAVVTDASGRVYTAEDGCLPKGNYTISIYSDGVLMTAFRVNMIHDEYDFAEYIVDARISVPKNSRWEYKDGVYKYGFGCFENCSNLVPCDVSWSFVFELKDSIDGDNYKKFDDYEYYWINDGTTLWYYNKDSYVNKAEIRIKDSNGNWISMEDESGLPLGKYELIVSVDGKVCDTLKIDLYKEHEYMNEWNYNETHHWFKCIVCDKKKAYAAHKSSSWNSDVYRHWKKCTVCGTEYISKEHTLKTTTTLKATATKAGTRETRCTACNKLTKKSEIKPASNIKLSKTVYAYDGTAKKPSVTVKTSEGTVLKKDTDYTVTYATGRKAVGKYKVTVKGIGKYQFTKSLYFKINPKKPVISAITSGTCKLTVKMKTKVSATGGAYYKIGYKVKGTSTWKYITTTYQSKVIKNLKKGKKYNVKVCAIKTVNKVKYTSPWTDVKTSAAVK